MMRSWSSWRAGTAKASGWGPPLVLMIRSDMSHIRRLISATTGECAMAWTIPWNCRLSMR